MISIDDKLFKESVQAVAATKDGKIMLAYLKDYLQWEDILMSVDSTEANIYYQTRRAVYGWLRKLIPLKERKEIEYNYQRKAVDNGTSGRKSSNGAKRTSRTK